MRVKIEWISLVFNETIVNVQSIEEAKEMQKKGLLMGKQIDMQDIPESYKMYVLEDME